MPLDPAVSVWIGNDSGVPEPLVDRVMHVSVDPEWRLVARDEFIEV